MHKHTELRDSVVHGQGIFVTKPIQEGEVVWFDETCACPVERDLIPVSLLQSLEPAKAEECVHFAYQVSESMLYCFNWREGGYAEEEARTGSDFINHSCDPSIIFHGNAGTQIAARDLAPGDEVTYDYATSETIDWPWQGEGMHCRCGSKLCRGLVRHDDWRRPDLQERYGRKGFLPFIWEMIEDERRPHELQFSRSKDG